MMDFGGNMNESEKAADALLKRLMIRTASPQEIAFTCLLYTSALHFQTFLRHA